MKENWNGWTFFSKTPQDKIFYEKLLSSSRVFSYVHTSDGWTEGWSEFISTQNFESTQERKSELCVGLDELF